MTMKKQKKYRQDHLPHMLLAQQALPNCNSISAECPDAERYTEVMRVTKNSKTKSMFYIICDYYITHR